MIAYWYYKLFYIPVYTSVTIFHLCNMLAYPRVELDTSGNKNNTREEDMLLGVESINISHTITFWYHIDEIRLLCIDNKYDTIIYNFMNHKL